MRAQRSEAKPEFNKILFSLSGQSWTLRDQQIYQAVLGEIFKKKNLSPYSSGESDDFVLSRLSEKESSLFDLNYEAVKANETQKKHLSNFTSAEVNKEIAAISKASAIIEIKESKKQDQSRFKTWVELLKRKYQFKIKSAEITPTAAATPGLTGATEPQKAIITKDGKMDSVATPLSSDRTKSPNE